MLYATVRQRKIYVKKPTTVIQNGVGVDELTLDMDAEWGSMDSIICVFTLKYTESTSTTETDSDGNTTTKITTETKEITKQMLHTYGTTLLVPWECLVKTGLLSVSCTGYVGSTKIMTTMLPDSFWNVVQNGAITGDETIDPTPTLYQQIVAAADAANAAAATANETASEIRAAAAAGKYDGKSTTVKVGSTTTAAAGAKAQVKNSGTAAAMVLDFTIPQGPQGPKGEPGLTEKTVTQADIHWHAGWEAPNKVNDTDDLAGCTGNLATNKEGRTSMTPLWIPSGTVLWRNDDYYKAIDAADSGDTQPVQIIVSRYDPENKSANPNGWVKVQRGAMRSIPYISLTVSGWYVLSTVYGHSGKDNRLYGQPYTFRYTLEQDMEPNYVFTLDWGTYYTIRDNSYSQPAFSNGLNWVCRREPGCPYYLHNSGSGSDFDRGRYKTTDLTLDTKTGSSVSGILSYRDEIWSFYGSADDHSGLGSVSKIKVYDNHWIEYLGVCWVNAGHINSVSYDAATDTVAWGNGSTDYTLEGEGYLLNNFSTSALATAYQDEICLLDDMGVETVSLPIATYGVKANLIPVGTDHYNSGVMSLIVALLTNDGNTLRFGHIQGTAAAKPQYHWTNCSWGDAVTIGDAGETIGGGSTESYQHCVQDMTVWDGKLTWGEGHGENRIAQLRQTPDGSTRESTLFQPQPGSGIAALTAHGRRLFGSGVNLFCLLGDSQIPYTYGKTPGETVAELPIVAEVNYWDLGTRHEATRLEVQGVDSTTETLIFPTDTRTISYDYYVRGGTTNGYWVLSGGEKQPTLEINGNDFTITQTAAGYGLALPVQLTVGKAYKISYTASGGHRVYHCYYDATGVYQKLVQIVNSDAAGGTFEWTFTVEDYACCVLLIRADSGSVTFTDVRVVEA